MDKKQIRDLRCALALSQNEFAELIGTSKATVSAWENGHQRPSVLHEYRLEQQLSKIRKTKQV